MKSLNLIKAETLKTLEGPLLSDNTDKIQSMADLLRSGATLTNLSCPACSSPLFRLKNVDLWCVQCKKKVITVKGDEQIEETKRFTALGALESTLLEKIQEINDRIHNENDLEELRRLSLVMGTFLENLERTRKMGRYRT
jgi:UPF0148 protein